MPQEIQNSMEGGKIIISSEVGDGEEEQHYQPKIEKNWQKYTITIRRHQIGHKHTVLIITSTKPLTRETPKIIKK